MRRLFLAILPGIAFFATVSPVNAANPDHLQRLLKTNQCPNCDLSNADLTDTNLFGANLANANLKGAILKSANLGSANFSDADLSGANLQQAYLDRATLENANLTQANLSGAYLKNATTTGVQLRGATLRGAKLQNADLIGVNLQGADFSETNLSGVFFSGFRSIRSATIPIFGSMYSPAMFTALICQNAPFSSSQNESEEFRRLGIEFVPANLVGSNFTGANLADAVLIRGNLTNANLTGANLKNACLIQANLRGAVLDRADLQSALLKAAILEGASLKETRNANLAETFQNETDARQKEVEAQVVPNMRAMMRAQQAYLLEHTKFATKVDELQLGLKDSEQYAYRVFSQGDRTRLAAVAAVPKTAGFRTYIGLVSTSRGSRETVSMTRLCVSQEAKPVLPKLPLNVPNSQPPACPTGFQAVN
jgi:uncharacterized protein YjbI with pentapeptide repeats